MKRKIAFDPDFIEAIHIGDLVLCKKLLPYVDPDYCDSFAFREAAEWGHLHICKWLLYLPGKYEGAINPSAKHNSALIWAKHFCHTEVCKWLLKLPKEHGIIDTSKLGKDEL